MTAVLMVCLGNICRSPLAEGIFKQLVAARGLDAEYRVDSAGIADHHAGELPHRGSLAVAASRGIDISDQRSRQVTRADFTQFDWLIAMDTSNRNALLHMAPPDFPAARVRLLLDFAPYGPRDVPDPYYTGGFDAVYDLIEAGCEGLLAALEAKDPA